MLSRLRKEWRDFKALPAGERFRAVHERQAGAPTWTKVAVVVAAMITFGIGVVLVFIPGPAIVFFGLSGALVATQSIWVAGTLDRGEVAVRKLVARVRRRRRRAQRVSRSF